MEKKKYFTGQQNEKNILFQWQKTNLQMED